MLLLLLEEGLGELIEIDGINGEVVLFTDVIIEDPSFKVTVTVIGSGFLIVEVLLFCDEVDSLSVTVTVIGPTFPPLSPSDPVSLVV